MKPTDKKRAAVLTRDRNLYRKIALELIEDFDTVMISDGIGARGFDAVFVDTDEDVFFGIDGIRMTRGEGKEGDLSLPFRLGEARRLAMGQSHIPLSIDLERRGAILRGQRVQLTEVEFALFRLLYERGGEFVTREEILSSVWGGAADGGVINVYIHYLRDKLESGGEKIIISSRKCGYKIDEKYFIGEVSYASDN